MAEAQPPEDSFSNLAEALFQPERGLYIVPIRHHSPACAAALAHLMDDLRPAHVLIEAPADFGNLIPILTDAETRPPVAVVSLLRTGAGPARAAAYYPFCAHSPEFVALIKGHELGAQTQFIDLPAGARAVGEAADHPMSLADDTSLTVNSYVDALASKTGCRDGFELWDHLFETRIGNPDWRQLFRGVGAYCAAIRAATPFDQIEANGDHLREAHMALQIRKTLASKTGPVVVVVGGFHAPRLVEPEKVTVQGFKKPTSENYIIRYGYAAMDALHGYGAGLPQPEFYERLWQSVSSRGEPPDWRKLAGDILSDFTVHMRSEGHMISLPAKVEALRAAEALAHLRGRPGIMRHDLIDGVRTALAKGEVQGVDVWTERLTRFLTGTALGDVPLSAGSPPLVEDVRARATRHRIALDNGAEVTRKLDIRRKPSQRASSQFFHALDLLDVPFAVRISGPDFFNEVQTERLFEEWRFAWSPRTEARLIELSAMGDRLPHVCLAFLAKCRSNMEESGEARNLSQLVELLKRGILAGLGEELLPFLDALKRDLATFGGFVDISSAMQTLAFMARSAGPMGAPESLDLNKALELAYLRLTYLVEDLPATREDDLTAHLDALQLVHAMLDDPALPDLDRVHFDRALDQVLDRNCPPALTGAILAICLQSGFRPADDLLSALSGRFSGVVLKLEDRIGVLRGILHTSPQLLWRVEALLEAVDEFLLNLSDDDFVSLLPHLRLAFAGLHPGETDKLAAWLGKRHEESAGVFQSGATGLNQTDLALGLAMERQLKIALAQDGLSDWIKAEHGP